MNKKIISITMSSIAFLGNAAYTQNVYANGNSDSKNLRYGNPYEENEYDKIVGAFLPEIAYEFPMVSFDEIDRIPQGDEWNDYEVTLTKEDGTVIKEGEEGKDLYFRMDHLQCFVRLNVLKSDYKGKITFKIEQKSTGKFRAKEVYILSPSDVLTGKVEITGNPVEGGTLSAITSGLPSDAVNVKYRWYVDGVRVPESSGKDFKLTKEYAGKKIGVKVVAQNYYKDILAPEVLVSPKVVETVSAETLFDGLRLTNKGKELANILENGIEKDGKLFKIKQNSDHKINKLADGSYELIMNFVGEYKFSNAKSENEIFNFQVKVTGKNSSELEKISKIFTLRDGKVEGTDIKEIIGSNRAETAVKISNENFNPVDKNGSVVLVGSNAVVDGLSAGPLAKLLNAPLLLTNSNSLDSNVEKEIKRLLVSNTKPYNLETQTVYIVGGESVISENVVNQLKQLGIKVERLSGTTRDTTSLAVAKKMEEKNAKFEKAFVVGAKGEADAMSIAAHAAKEEAPVIVTALNGSLTDEAKNLINEKQIDIIGGESVVTTKLEEELKSIDKDNNITRVKGSNRFETNANVIKTYYSGSKHVYVAKDGQKEGNDKLVDALAISPIAGKNDGVVVLATNDLTKSQEDALKSISSTETKLTKVGGGISNSVITKIAKTLGFVK